jgi:hypothetical protein
MRTSGGQRSAVSGQRSAVSGRWSAARPRRRPLTRAELTHGRKPRSLNDLVELAAGKLRYSTPMAKKTSALAVGDLVARIEAPTVLYRVTTKFPGYVRALPYRRSGREQLLMPIKQGARSIWVLEVEFYP